MSTSAADGWTASVIATESIPVLAMTMSATAVRGTMSAPGGTSGTTGTTGNMSGTGTGTGIGRGTLTRKRGAGAAATPWKRGRAGEMCLRLHPNPLVTSLTLCEAHDARQV